MAVEQEWCEYKSGKGGMPDISDTISAFSNTEGGKIFIGIDNGQNVVGLTPHQLDEYQRKASGLCRSNHFNEKIWPRISIIEDAPVVCIEITPLPIDQRPLYKTSVGLPRGAFYRVGSTNVPCDDDMLRSFYRNSAQGSSETRIINGITVADLDAQKIESYRRVAEQRNPLIFSEIANDRLLLNAGATKDGSNVTLLGLLLFGTGELIRRHAPNCKIVFSHYQGVQKVDQATGLVIQLDDKEFTGTIDQQYTRAFEYLRSKLPVGAHLSGTVRVRHDEMSVPQDAIREVLANTLAHRDYGNAGSPILIEMFDDRIEFTNPGQSLVPIEQLSTHQAVSRNPQLMSILRDYGIAEQRGRGIPTIVRVMENADLPPPNFKNIGDTFSACLTSANFLSAATIAWLDSSFGHLSLNLNQRRFLAWLKANGNRWLTNNEYRIINHLGNNQSLASREIRKLVQQSVLIGNEKTRRGAAYKLAPHLE